MPPSADGTLAPIEAFQQQGREVNDPAVDRRMIDLMPRSAIISFKSRRLKP
jgi:hypothetical protein